MDSTSSFATPSPYRLSAEQFSSGEAFEMALVSPTQSHGSHPSIGGLLVLVFSAVLEVVCVSLPGYIVARLGYFDADKQKFLANLNVMLFTPCLIFTKLASQLSASKFLDLAIIPVIFALQTVVAWLGAAAINRAFGFERRAANFVTAMGVFGNSNSLPISLVLSLSQTLKGLHWQRIPGDNDDEVGARGILYLLIFQQLGQLLRWSWGYHVLLAPPDHHPEYREQEEGRYRDDETEATDGMLIPGLDGDGGDVTIDREGIILGADGNDLTQSDGSEYEPAGRTPVVGQSRTSPADSEDEDGSGTGYPKKKRQLHTDLLSSYPLNPAQSGDILSFPRIRSADEADLSDGPVGALRRLRYASQRRLRACCRASVALLKRQYHRLPEPVHTKLTSIAGRTADFIWEFMNPPLWAMLIAVVVASVPWLQRLFFEEGSFVANSVTSAVRSSGGVAVPLILVVLGANLARNTQSVDARGTEEEAVGRKLLVASLVCRMVLPTLIMAPVLAMMAKYLPISILDDPIFVIVCFLLTGSPSALQLAQICQINGVFEGVISQVLFHGYVVWILPSTLILVMCALEVVEWAAAP